MPSTSGVALTGNPDIDGVLSGIKWATNSLTFSFPDLMGEYGYSLTGFEAFNAAQQAAVQAVLGLYASVSNLTFAEVTESASVHGDLRFAEEDNAGTAYAYYPSSSEYGGDAWFNHIHFNNPLLGSYAFTTLIHEIGHGLGMKHGQEGPVALPYDHDSAEYSVMTYRSYVGSPGDFYTIASGDGPQSLMLSDIAAIQSMYGANYAANAGDSVYTFSPTTGEMSVDGVGQGPSTANTIFRTVWDGGGTDTYDFSNYATNLTVDLRPGEWSTVSTAQLANLGYDAGLGGTQWARGNIANAWLFEDNPASLIENAIGGSGNDTIVGNEAGNTLEGGLGDDTLFGMNGPDVLNGGDGNDQLWGSSGNDVLNGDAGDDQLGGGGGNDQILGSDGDDVVWGGWGNDRIGGAAGRDQIWAGPGNDTVWGGADDDQIGGGDGSDQLWAGEGNDTIWGGNGDDQIGGGGGQDEIWAGSGNDAIWGGSGSDIIGGGSGNDTLWGGDGDDSIWGGGDDDTIYSQAGDDEVFGGSGVDTFVFDLAAGFDTIWDWQNGVDLLDLTALAATGVHQFTDLVVDVFGDYSTVSFGGNMITFDGFTDAFDFADWLFA